MIQNSRLVGSFDDLRRCDKKMAPHFREPRNQSMRSTIAINDFRKVGNKFFSEEIFGPGGKLYRASAAYAEEKNFYNQEAASNYDIFLVHQSRDRGFVASFKHFLADRGFSVFVDWLQPTETGRHEFTLKAKLAMSNARTLVYLHTHASVPSRWLAWEIGYFDGMKNRNAIGVLPFLNHSGLLPHYGGMEFLQNYTQIGVEYLETFVRHGQI